MQTKTDKIVIVDFSGTLIRPEVAEKANLKRYKLLGIPEPGKNEHKRLHGTKEHYQIIQDYIEKELGITDKMQVGYVQNHGKDITLTGKEIKTAIMTDLFRNAMFQIAKEMQLNIFQPEIITTLQEIQKRGYKLAIVSGIRKDIITGMFEIAKCPLKFDYIYAQDPILSRDDNQYPANFTRQHGEIKFILGDKLSDLEPAKKFNAKSIFLRGGHPTGGEENFADFTINKPGELLKIIT